MYFQWVFLSPSHDGILSWVLFPVVLLVHSKPLGLLPVIVCCIQRGLQTLTKAFCRLPASKRGKGRVLPRNGPCPLPQGRNALYILDGVVYIVLSHHHSTRKRAVGRHPFCASPPIREIIMGANLYSQGTEADTLL